ncbi:hypothetical protein COCVIDRAFT_12528 [Bipolaris victoriae FI3]|uniref:Uncharacterized protein n=1 Tax=Bipolaris victoriae (strain FI3) TaxID=930091 RepID=W7ELD7_BIPV3|nr:hypothetical protein COCVIDRAFT_12528 [Bipolaris victoriae FI3]
MLAVPPRFVHPVTPLSTNHLGTSCGSTKIYQVLFHCHDQECLWMFSPWLRQKSPTFVTRHLGLLQISSDVKLACQPLSFPSRTSPGIPRDFFDQIAESRLWIMPYAVGVLVRKFVPNAASCAGQSYIECEVKSQDQFLQRAR